MPRMITRTSSSCYSHLPLQTQSDLHDEIQVNPSSSFLFNLSLLKDKVHQIQSLATILISPENDPTAVAIPTIGNLIQEIIVAASSMMFSCQQMAATTSFEMSRVRVDDREVVDWYGKGEAEAEKKEAVVAETETAVDYDIVELDAADLLAKYTHYCQICGKGFKRDANLRMHMRAHGDEYKSSAALSNPMKNGGEFGDGAAAAEVPRKYSCPHEGCR